MELEGLPHSEYVFIDAKSGVYLYHKDAELLNTETSDPGYQEILRRVQSNRSDRPDTYTYKGEDGKNQFVVYQYLENRDWIFMVRDNADEVYSTVASIQLKVGFICVAVLLLILTGLIVMMRRVGHSLVTVERAIERLGQLDLETDKDLSSLHDRNDEIGSIARTTHALCDRLRLTIEDIGRILGEMADGNIAVDVVRGESYYIGDFQTLAVSLKTIRTKLLQLIQNISQVAHHVSDEAVQVSQHALSLSQGILTQESSVARLTESTGDIVVQIHSSTDRCAAAQELADQAAQHAADANAKMVHLTHAMDNITHSSTEIKKITKIMEDIASRTNILALNAAVEAARAGAAGTGFAVVAEQVRALAAKSSAAAKDTAALISRSIQDVHSGMEATQQTASIMQIIGECTGSIKEQMHGISEASTRQAGMITNIDKEIEEIAQVVRDNSAAVGESTDALQKLSEEAYELDRLVGQFQTEH